LLINAIAYLGQEGSSKQFPSAAQSFSAWTTKFELRAINANNRMERMEEFIIDWFVGMRSMMNETIDHQIAYLHSTRYNK